MISHLHRYIFVHIPKCAGTSIETALIPHEARLDRRLQALPLAGDGRQHWPLRTLHDQFPTSIGYLVAAVIRNPWERVISELAHFGHELAPPSIQWLLTRNFIGNHPLMPQVEFLKNQQGRLGVDLLMRFETLAEDFGSFCRKVGLPEVQLTHQKPTRHEHYSRYFDEPSMKAVAERYASDIAQFGYRFERTP